MLMSAILEVDVVFDVLMTSTPNVLRTELCDLLYNQCIVNTYCYLFFTYPTGQIRVCKVRLVSTGENLKNLVWYARKNISRDIMKLS